MNWSDFLVVAVIVGFGIIGMVNGFIYSMFKIASFFVSIFISVKFYPVVAKILMKTAMFTNIKGSIFKSLMLQQAQAPNAGTQVKQAAADSIINSLHLPGFLKGTLLSQMPDPTKLIDISKIMDMVSGELAKVVIDILALVLLYIAIRIGLFFLKFILQGIAKLPVFKQMDKLGGFAFGAIEGLLTVYIVFAVLMLFHSAPQFKEFFVAVDNSVVAKFFYQNNFVIGWMFPKGGAI